MHRPKLGRRHFFIEAADPADDSVRNEQAHKGQSHHGGIHFGRRGARNQGEKRGPIIEEGDSQASAVEEWPEWMNRRGARKEDCQYQDQVAGGGKKGAGADLGQFVRLATSQCLLPPDPEQQRHARDAENRIDRLEPWHRDPEAAHVERDVLLNPDRTHVEDLTVSD